MLQNLFHNHYCLDDHLGIGDWDFTLFRQCERHKQLKETESFWQHQVKTFYPLGLTEKEEYLHQHTLHMRVRQSVMKEFWLCFSFINFLIINLFKFVFQFMCMYIFVRFTFKLLEQAFLLRFSLCFFTQKYCYLFLFLLITFSLLYLILLLLLLTIL